MVIEKNKGGERIGIEKYNKNGDLMKVIAYQDANHIIVEFQDNQKTQKRTTWDSFNKGTVKNPNNSRLYLTNYNTQGCLMKVVVYNSSDDIIVEFQDKYKAHVHTAWKHFNNGGVKNPYYPSVCGVGILGNKYPACYFDEKGKKKNTKEYQTWCCMLHRCFDKKEKDRYPTYQDVVCCEEWLLFENFYEWLHSQENFDKWVNLYMSALDKDILIKGNKIYSPNACCLVPVNINTLFVKSDAIRGNYPIGVVSHNNKCRAQLLMGNIYLNFPSRENYQEAFIDYKNAKEKWIKQVAQEEYEKGTITKRCYDAMMNYEVEITD